MRPQALALAALATLLIAPVASAQGGVASLVQAGDEDLRATLETREIRIGFLDLDGNGRVTVSVAEPIYLDLDRSRSVTFGDVRLTSFLNYPPSTAVNYTNRDLGSPLSEARGWFAQADSGAWYIDINGEQRVSAGDLRLTGDLAPGVVEDGDGDVGDSVETAQNTMLPRERTGSTSDARRPYAAPYYVDLNGDGQVSVGDIRFKAATLSPEDPVFQDDLTRVVERLERLVQNLTAQLAKMEADLGSEVDGMSDDIARNGQQLSTLSNRVDALESGADAAQDDGSGEDSGSSGVSTIFLVLTIVNLVGLGAVAYLVIRRTGPSHGHGPR